MNEAPPLVILEASEPQASCLLLMRHLLLAGAACLIAAPATAWAGAWTQPQGDFYAKAWTRSLIGSAGNNGAYFADGEVREIDIDYVDHAANLYGEYGVTDLWTAVVHGAVFGAAKVGDESTTYVGPLGLGVRRALSTGDMRVAVEARYLLAPAVGDGSLAAGEVDGRSWYFAPTLSGQGGHAELQLGTGTSFGWWTASAGGTYLDADGVGASLGASVQIGWKVSETVDLPLTIGLVEPLDELDHTNVSGAGRTRYLGWGLDVGWWFMPRVGLTAGLGGVVYAASNAATPSLLVGLQAR